MRMRMRMRMRLRMRTRTRTRTGTMMKNDNNELVKSFHIKNVFLAVS